MKQYLRNIAFTLDNAAFTATATQQLTQKITLAEAYEVQQLSIANRAKRGDIIKGYKLGFTSKAKMEQMGVHDIIWGRLTSEMHLSQGGPLIHNKFIHPRAEPEIAFLTKKQIDKAISMEELPDYIEKVAAALEVIDSRYQNFKFSLEDVVADNCSSAAFVLGDWWEFGTKVQNLGINLKINGKVVQTGNSNAILGNPFESFIALSRMAEKYNTSIAAGSIVLAGAATSAVAVAPGDQVEGEFEGLGTVKLAVI
jgi:2-oxo-3-hexenedioate decarboxylase